MEELHVVFNNTWEYMRAKEHFESRSEMDFCEDRADGNALVFDDHEQLKSVEEELESIGLNDYYFE